MVDRWSTWTSDVYQCVYFAVLLVTDVLIFGLEAVGELGEAAFRLVLSIKGWPPKPIAKIAARRPSGSSHALVHLVNVAGG